MNTTAPLLSLFSLPSPPPPSSLPPLPSSLSLSPWHNIYIAFGAEQLLFRLILNT